MFKVGELVSCALLAVFSWSDRTEYIKPIETNCYVIQSPFNDPNVPCLDKNCKFIYVQDIYVDCSKMFEDYNLVEDESKNPKMFWIEEKRCSKVEE